jgi:hypothetical protein
MHDELRSRRRKTIERATRRHLVTADSVVFAGELIRNAFEAENVSWRLETERHASHEATAKWLPLNRRV